MVNGVDRRESRRAHRRFQAKRRATRTDARIATTTVLGDNHARTGAFATYRMIAATTAAARPSRASE